MANANDYPKAKYHKDGGYRAVATPEEESDLGGDWGDEPQDIHRNARDPAINAPPTENLTISSAGFEQILRRVLREELGGSDDDGDTSKPRRGRPPGSRNRAATATDGDENNG